MADKKPPLTFEDAHIFFRNFAGREQMYNAEGNRNFCVSIPDEKLAQQMIKDGWNVKQKEVTDEGEQLPPYIQVTVRFDILPPTIVMITSKARTMLDETTVDTLDWAEIETVDLNVNARIWTTDDGRSRIKAYLKSMYVTIAEDDLAKKYAIDLNPEK